MSKASIGDHFLDDMTEGQEVDAVSEGHKINNASEGSVSVQTENDYPPGSVQWFQQTRYGSAFWAATIAYRSVHYLSNKKPVVGAGPWWGGVGGFGRWPR